MMLGSVNLMSLGVSWKVHRISRYLLVYMLLTNLTLMVRFTYICIVFTYGVDRF